MPRVHAVLVRAVTSREYRILAAVDLALATVVAAALIALFRM